MIALKCCQRLGYFPRPDDVLTTARSINDGVAQINVNLDDTLRLANMIKTDTGNILTGARAADRNLDCIENGGLTGAGTVPGPVPC